MDMNQLNLNKKILRSSIAAATTLVLTASPAWAAGGSGDPWKDFLYKTINAVVFFGILYFVARKPIGQFLRNSATETRASYLETREASERVASELAEQRRKLEDLQSELNNMVEEARKDAEVERQQLEADAKAQAERIKSHVQQQTENEMLKARIALQTQLADDTAKLAEEMIRKQMDGKMQDKLVEEFTDQLEAGR